LATLEKEEEEQGGGQQQRLQAHDLSPDCSEGRYCLGAAKGLRTVPRGGKRKQPHCPFWGIFEGRWDAEGKVSQNSLF
jgi:hypothetical protein